MTLLKRLPAQLSAVARCSGSIRSISAIPEAVENDETVTVTVNPYKLHRLEEGPSTEVETSKSELLGMFKTMYTMRRMELAADLLYKQKLARGFLHLADGQEAVPTGAAYDLPFAIGHANPSLITATLTPCGMQQLHLVVSAGMEAALTFQDSIIQSYRDHCTFLGRGGTVRSLLWHPSILTSSLCSCLSSWKFLTLT